MQRAGGGDRRSDTERFERLRVAQTGVEAVVARSSQSFDRHTHETFGIGVIERGAQRSLSGRGHVEAGPGDVITCNPGEVHDGAPIGDGGRTWRIVYFAPPLVAAAAEHLDGPSGYGYEFTSPALRDVRVSRLAHRLFAATTATQPAALAQEELLLALLRRLGDANSRAFEAPTPPSIARAKRRIDDDPAAAVTLADLARESQLSRWQVLRGFARSTGLTPHAYVLQRRIDLARRLIAGGVALAEAAVMSGFADQSHMTRTFRRRYGLSPRVWAAAAR